MAAVGTQLDWQGPYVACKGLGPDSLAPNKPDKMVGLSYSSRTWDVEAGRPEVQDHPWLHRKSGLYGGRFSKNKQTKPMV